MIWLFQPCDNCIDEIAMTEKSTISNASFGNSKFLYDNVLRNVHREGSV